jgi:TPR repeat protein
VRQDRDAAMTWFDKAAKQGHMEVAPKPNRVAAAPTRLAARWRADAAKGDAEAQDRLAKCLSSQLGQGLTLV